MSIEEETEEHVGPAIPTGMVVAPVGGAGGEEKEEEEDVGPPVPKKRKAVNQTELTLLENLPAADRYEKSYMHRGQVLFTTVTPKTNFVVTASADGHVKFWKKLEIGLEFVKDYRAHLSDITSVDCSDDGLR